MQQKRPTGGNKVEGQPKLPLSRTYPSYYHWISRRVPVYMAYLAFFFKFRY